MSEPCGEGEGGRREADVTPFSDHQRQGMCGMLRRRGDQLPVQRWDHGEWLVASPGSTSSTTAQPCTAKATCIQPASHAFSISAPPATFTLISSSTRMSGGGAFFLQGAVCLVLPSTVLRLRDLLYAHVVAQPSREEPPSSDVFNHHSSGRSFNLFGEDHSRHTTMEMTIAIAIAFSRIGDPDAHRRLILVVSWVDPIRAFGVPSLLGGAAGAFPEGA